MKLRSLLAALVLLTGPAASAAGQSVNHLDHVHTPATYATLDAWESRASWLRDHILVSNGLYPMPEPTPLRPRASEITRGDGYTVQAVALETWPGFFLTGTIYRPADGEGPFPGILSAHGHWEHGRFEHTDLASIPGRAIAFARQGYVVFSYSMIGYNETAGRFPHRFDDPTYQLWGFSAMGLQLWNSRRALDYLSALPEVDAGRIGMTGASGGGTQTFILTAIDPRIRVAAPVNMISAHFQGGCICENSPLLRIDAHNVEIGALAAPRPLMMISTAGDWTVNTPDVEFPAMQAIYALHGAADRVANVHLGYPHNYNAESRAAVYDWFARWLSPANGALPEPVELRLLPADTLLADLPRPPAGPDALFRQYKAAAEDALQHARPVDTASLEAYRAVYGKALSHVLHDAPGDHADRMMYFAPTPAKEVDSAVLIVHSATAASARTARALARQHQIEGRLVAVLSPLPDPPAPPDSIAYWTTYNAANPVRQIRSIHHAIETLGAREDIKRVDVIGLDEAGVWTLFARALSPQVRTATVHMNGVDFAEDEDFLTHLPVPLIRRAGDLKTAVAMIAPAPLTLTHLPEGELASWIRALYADLGASHALHLSTSDQ